MSEEKEKVENTYQVEYASTGRASCKDKSCKGAIEKGSMRVGIVRANPFHEGTMTNWYHPKCCFATVSRMREGTKRLESKDQLEGYDGLKDADKKTIDELFSGAGEEKPTKKRKAPKKKKKADEDEEEEEEEEEEEPKKKKEKAEAKTSADDETLSEKFEVDSKFWNIDVNGNAITVQFGKIGNDGRTTTKTLADNKACIKEAKKLIAKKKKEGYEEAGSKKEEKDEEEEEEKTEKKEKKKPAKAKASKKKKAKKEEEEDEEEEEAEEKEEKEEKKASKATSDASAGKVHLESDSSSGGKFWEVWVEGSELSTRWGRLETDGQSNTKDFGTPEKAEKEKAKLIKQKTSKGYHA
eukprot:TRINITY_DN304_c0_g4_i1.p1 TRINITY_DN304_c0_g4~~TRINITY_DN304_c0_g4_i1.p1  ORF type:complete len:370 (-),score=142.66 TRINITY_DN304_c0_g4_i1:232-1290(-)